MEEQPTYLNPTPHQSWVLTVFSCLAVVIRNSLNFCIYAYDCMSWGLPYQKRGIKNQLTFLFLESLHKSIFILNFFLFQCHCILEKCLSVIWSRLVITDFPSPVFTISLIFVLILKTIKYFIENISSGGSWQGKKNLHVNDDSTFKIIFYKLLNSHSFNLFKIAHTAFSSFNFCSINED